MGGDSNLPIAGNRGGANDRRHIFSRLKVVYFASFIAGPSAAAMLFHPHHNGCALNVSHARTCPLSRPRLNQRTRCSELPWVKASGTT